MQHHDKLISAETLQDHLGDPELCVIDCRFDLMQPDAGRQEYLREHIPGAGYAHLDEDLAAPIGRSSGRHPLPDAAELARTFGRLGVGSSTQVVVYDDASGAIAGRAWWLLRWIGHERVALLDGGFARWRSLGLPLRSGQFTMPPREITARPRSDLVLETADIVDALATDIGLQLVDARDAARFRGEREPIDRVAGHVPGAISLPYSANLNPDGTWKPGDTLRRIWCDTLSGGVDAPLGVMCGSGVTACHHVLSRLLAGLSEPRVYVGSWSEWIRDPARPISQGAGSGRKGPSGSAEHT